MYPLNVKLINSSKAGLSILQKVQEIISEIMKVSDNGVKWSPVIREIIGNYDINFPTATRCLLEDFLLHQINMFKSGSGSITELKFMVEDFEFSNAVFIGDGQLASNIVLLDDALVDPNFQFYVSKLLQKYIE